MMLLDAVTVLALSPLIRSFEGMRVCLATASTTGVETSTSLKVATYCAAALVEYPFALTAGTTTLASAWYGLGCRSRTNPVSAAATKGTTIGSHSHWRMARR